MTWPSGQGTVAEDRRGAATAHDCPTQCLPTGLTADHARQARVCAWELDGKGGARGDAEDVLGQLVEAVLGKPGVQHLLRAGVVVWKRAGRVGEGGVYIMMVVRQQRLVAQGGQAPRPPHLGLHPSKHAAQAIVCMRAPGTLATSNTQLTERGIGGGGEAARAVGAVLAHQRNDSIAAGQALL